MMVRSNQDDTMKSTVLIMRHWPNAWRKKPNGFLTRLPLPQPTFQKRLPAFQTHHSIRNGCIYVKNR